jgi:hypothetical protein
MSGTAEATDPTILTTYGGALAKTAAEAYEGPRAEMGERVIRTFLAQWDDPAVRSRMLPVVRAALDGGAGADQMRAFMTQQLFGLIGANLSDGTPMDLEGAARELGIPALNINAAAAQVWGVIVLRYVMPIEPMASAPTEDIVALIGRTMQSYLVL